MTAATIPAPGFTMISGQRNPPDDGTKYTVQFRNGFIDRRNAYSPNQLRWTHDGGEWDVVAVRKV